VAGFRTRVGGRRGWSGSVRLGFERGGEDAVDRVVVVERAFDVFLHEVGL
jgi:hypothetical protein